MDIEGGSDLVNVAAVTWVAAFPWLPAVASSSADWWANPIEDETGKTDASVIALVAELATERISHWSIGQILPALRTDVQLRFLDFPTRASNALARHSLETTGDLAGEALASLMDWRGIGAGTINSILEILIGVSTSAAQPVSTGSELQPKWSVAAVDPSIATWAWLEPVARDIELIANWYSAVGSPDQPLLSDNHSAKPPEVVSTALERLRRLRARDAAAGEGAQRIAVTLDAAFRTLSPRAVEILRERLFGYHPPTLDQLGGHFGVTRERVRQIEGKARGALLAAVAESAMLRAVSTSVVQAIGSVQALTSLLEAFPSLADEVLSVEQPAWRVLDQLDDAYQIVDGWCAIPTISAAEAATQTRLLEATDQYGVARIQDLNVVSVVDTEDRDATTKAWLGRCGYVVDGDFVLTRTRSVGDYGAAILSIVGYPMSAQDIVDRFVTERSPGSLRNAMSQDDRFDRVDRELFALTEWGMEAYSGIRSVIREQIARNGGQANLEQVIEFITSRFSVSASSVAAYASSSPFELEAGVIRPARAERSTRKAPQATRRLFRRSAGWAYRITISTDHLRGSGSAAPIALATILDLPAGESTQLRSSLGPQTIAWTGIQPSFGSIRRFLIEADAEVNSDAFLVIGDDRTFAYEPARILTQNDVTDLLSLVGSAADVPDKRAALAKSVGLPEDVPYISLVASFRERGDEDIADRLIAARSELDGGISHDSRVIRSVDISEIMDLL